MNGASNYQSYLLQQGTILRGVNPYQGDSFEFVLGDHNSDGIIDLYAIKKRSTGSNSTEVHIMNGATNYQSYLLQTGTVLREVDSEFEFELGDLNKDGKVDLYAIKKRLTGSNKTEVHVMNGATNYQSYLYQGGTVLREVDEEFEFLVPKP